MKLPTYETKLASEATWAALLTATGLFLTALGGALDWDMAKVAPVITTGLAVLRLGIGMLLPSPPPGE